MVSVHLSPAKKSDLKKKLNKLASPFTSSDSPSSLSTLDITTSHQPNSSAGYLSDEFLEAPPMVHDVGETVHSRRPSTLSGSALLSAESSNSTSYSPNYIATSNSIPKVSNTGSFTSHHQNASLSALPVMNSSAPILFANSKSRSNSIPSSLATKNSPSKEHRRFLSSDHNNSSNISNPQTSYKNNFQHSNPQSQLLTLPIPTPSISNSSKLSSHSGKSSINSSPYKQQLQTPSSPNLLLSTSHVNSSVPNISLVPASPTVAVPSQSGSGSGSGSASTTASSPSDGGVTALSTSTTNQKGRANTMSSSSGLMKPPSHYRAQSHSDHSSIHARPNSRLKSSSLSNSGSVQDSASNRLKLFPKITQQFQDLDKMITDNFGKRLSLLDNENEKLLDELDSKYQNLEEMINLLNNELKEMDKYIENLKVKKLTDLKKLNSKDLFNNLNDLNVRIDVVKSNMIKNNNSLSDFESQLDVLEKLKERHLAVEKNKKQISFFVFIIFIVLFLLKCLKFL